MNNQIEEGCLAIVVSSANPVNLGKVVRVGKFSGKFENFIGEDHWEVDKEMVSKYGRVNRVHRGSRLMRIDNLPDEDKESEKDLELENVK